METAFDAFTDLDLLGRVEVHGRRVRLLAGRESHTPGAGVG